MDPLSRAEGTFWTVWYYITGAVSRFLRTDSDNALSDDPNASKESELDDQPEQEDLQREDSGKPQSKVPVSETLVASNVDNQTNDLSQQGENIQQQPLAGIEGRSDCRNVKLDITVCDSDQTVCQAAGSKEPEELATIKSEQALVTSKDLEGEAGKYSEVEKNSECLQINKELKKTLHAGTSSFLSHQDGDGKTSEEEATCQKEEANRSIFCEVSTQEEQKDEEDAMLLQTAIVLKTTVDLNGNDNKAVEKKSDSYPDGLLELDKVGEHTQGATMTITQLEAAQEVEPKTPTGLSGGHLIESLELNTSAYEGTLPEHNNESVLNENQAQWFLEAGDDGKEIQLPEEVENSQNTNNIEGVHRADSTFDRLDENKNSGTRSIALCDTLQEASEILSDSKRTTCQLIGTESPSPRIRPTGNIFGKYCDAGTVSVEDGVPSMKSGQNGSGPSSVQDNMSSVEFVVDIQDAGIAMEDIYCGYDDDDDDDEEEEAAEDKRGAEILEGEVGSEGEDELLALAELSKNPEPDDVSIIQESNKELSKDLTGSLGIYCMDEKQTLLSDATCEDKCAAMQHSDLTDEEIEDLWSCAAMTEEPKKDTVIMQSSNEGHVTQFEGEVVTSVPAVDTCSASSPIILSEADEAEEDGVQTSQVLKTNSLADKVDASASVDVPEMSSQQDQGDPQMQIESLLEVDGVALDFVAQKSRIAVKNPNVRPPKDPRSLINMPSLSPSPVVPVPGMNVLAAGKAMPFKLPGLGVSFPGLKTTKRTVADHDSSDANSQGTDDAESRECSDGNKEAKQTPKWMPPRQSGFGNPLMSELKNKLKKTTDH